MALSALLAPWAHASHEDVGLGARSASLADAMTALGDEPGSAAMNPASLGQINRPGMEFGLRRFFQTAARATDLDGMAAAGGVPFAEFPFQGALGAYWSHDKLKDLSIDRTFGLVLASRGWREFGAATLDGGLTLKSLTRTGEEGLGKSSKAAFDAGFLLRLSDEESVGLSALNINGPRTDLVGIPDRAPVMVKLGYAHQVRRFKIALDLTRREPSAPYRATTSGAAGTEFGWGTASLGNFFGRTGLNLGGLARNWNVGLGWGKSGARLDYAIRIPLSNGSRWGHAVSLSYLFGSWNPESEYERMLRSELGYRRDLSRALEAAEIKQWKLAEELRMLRDEIETLRGQLVEQSAGRSEAEGKAQTLERQIRLKELEEKRRQAQRDLERLAAEREKMRRMNKDLLYSEDWRAYQDLKVQGAAEPALLERVRQILREYKGTGVDLGEAHNELQRLMRKEAPAP